MTAAADLIGQVRAAGGQITLDGIDLILTAPRPLPSDLLDQLKAHKPDIVRALVPWPPKRRGLGGYGTPPGVPPLAGCVMAQQIRAMPEGDSVPGDEVSAMPSLDATPPQPPGISPELQARSSAEDLAASQPATSRWGPSSSTKQAAIAREAEALKEFFEERAAILEYDDRLPRAEAELESARLTAALARNRSYLWASLRTALSGYPLLLSQLPATDGTVDALPLGTAKLAVLKHKRVVRQGTFTGAHEVKS